MSGMDPMFSLAPVAFAQILVTGIDIKDVSMLLAGAFSLHQTAKCDLFNFTSNKVHVNVKPLLP